MVMYCDVTWSQNGDQGRTNDDVFQELCFLWERRDSVGADFDLFNSETRYMHKNPNNTLKERKK